MGIAADDPATEAKHRIDLHTHSTCSDGARAPADIIRACAGLGVDICALTDHDTTAGLREAGQAAGEYGVTFVQGVELSCETDREIHILGYRFDETSEAFAAALTSMRDERRQRSDKMIGKLRSLGADISSEDVLVHARGESVGRPHIAMALVRKGFAGSVEEAFERYLRRGAPAYVQRVKLTPKKAIELVLSAGGIPVLAHPLLTGLSNIRPLLRELKSYGLQGIEAYYPAHNDAQCAEYESIARQYGLLVTAGSDYHGTASTAALGSETRTSAYLSQCVDTIVNHAPQ